MTKDKALTMIIASIAMEELALSHILNAEGEKLQYVLGTLPGGQKPCASTQEILAVNKSVEELLDTVIQSQRLLKGKMEKALEAASHSRPPKPPCPCQPHPDGPPCGGSGPCCRKSAIHLTGGHGGFTWENGCLLPWKCQEKQGYGIRWDEKVPELVGLDTGKAYALNYVINVRGPYSCDSAGAVFAKLTPCNSFSDLLPLYFSKCLECRPMTLQYSATLFPRANPAPWADLSLLLNAKGRLFVEQASLSIVEI